MGTGLGLVQLREMLKAFARHETQIRTFAREDATTTICKAGPPDQRLVEALREYLHDLESGRAPDPKAIQARHPEIANTLVACMEGIDIVNALAPSFREPGVGVEPADDLQPVPGTMRPLGAFLILRQIGPAAEWESSTKPSRLSLDRRVALKVLPFAAAMDPRHLQRFKNEAQAAAHLHHTNIVPIFGVGCERGVHYYAMQFIDGRTLAAVIHQSRRLLAGADRKTTPKIKKAGSGKWFEQRQVPRKRTGRRGFAPPGPGVE